MSKTNIKKPLILAILFLLPVIFLLFLYPSTNNYNALDVVKGDIEEISGFNSEDGKTYKLENQITVLGFLGRIPNNNAITALNLKEIIYDKFQGFKKFQVIIIVPFEAKENVKLLKKELYQYELLKYWHFVYGEEKEIIKVFQSLRSETKLDADLATNHVFIIDKELNQRGRLDDREDNEKAKGFPIHGLFSYDCIEVAELKNKMAKEDMRVLFTEYRQKRKGDFNSTKRRAEDLKNNEQD